MRCIDSAHSVSVYARCNSLASRPSSGAAQAHNKNSVQHERVRGPSHARNLNFRKLYAFRRVMLALWGRIAAVACGFALRRVFQRTLNTFHFQFHRIMTKNRVTRRTSTTTTSTTAGIAKLFGRRRGQRETIAAHSGFAAPRDSIAAGYIKIMRTHTHTPNNPLERRQ